MESVNSSICLHLCQGPYIQPLVMPRFVFCSYDSMCARPCSLLHSSKIEMHANNQQWNHFHLKYLIQINKGLENDLQISEDVS